MKIKASEKYGGHEWVKHEVKKGYCAYSSGWVSPDGDSATMVIIDGSNTFYLKCFTGIPGNEIQINELIFEQLWKQAEFEEDINSKTFEERSVFLADWFCSIFCTEDE